MGTTVRGGDSDDVLPSGESRGDDPLQRAAAVRALGRHADPAALDQLLALLDDPEWRVAEAALSALRRYRDPRIVPAIQALVERHRSFATLTRAGAISFEAARALRSQGEAGFQALLSMLPVFRADEVWGQAAVRQMAVWRDPRAIEPLIGCFSSPVYEVANAAAGAMRHFGVDAIPPLIAALSITDQSVSYHVSMALRWIGAPAVPALLDTLRHAADENVRAGAADVLDRADSEEVREALWVALDDPDEDVRSMAMWSLGELRDLRVLDLLLAEQPSQGPGSPEPASTLAWMGADAVSPLIAALEDQARPAYQRVNAAYALGRILGRIEDERTVEPLIAALRDGDEDVQVAAILALGYLKYASSVEPLLAALAVEPLLIALHDPSSDVRRRAADVLASSDDDRAFDAVARILQESGKGEEDDKFASDLLRELALHHGERTLPLLREAALSSSSRRWSSALVALSRLGAPGVSVLLEVGRDPRPERRHTAITWLKYAYGHSPDPRIVDFLFEVIQENPTSNIAEMMRYHAVLKLGECGDPRAVGPLLEYLQNAALPRTAKYSTVGPLGELGDERTLEALTTTLEESKAGEDGPDVGELPGQRHRFQVFQDALVWAMAKIRTRLGTTGAEEDTSSASAAT